MVGSRLSKLLTMFLYTTIVQSLVQVTEGKFAYLFNTSNAQPDVDPIVFLCFFLLFNQRLRIQKICRHAEGAI